jgi:hypothetical protein
VNLLRYVSPCLSPENETHKGAVDGEPSRNFELRKTLSPEHSYFSHGAIRKLGAPVCFSSHGNLSALLVPVMVIIGRRSKKQMRRFDATRRVASVTDKHSMGYRTIYKLVGNPMGKSAINSTDSSVSVLLSMPNPQEASGVGFRDGVFVEKISKIRDTLGHVGTSRKGSDRGPGALARSRGPLYFKHSTNGAVIQ